VFPQLANMRRSLDELKLLHRALSVSEAQAQQTAANFKASPVDQFVTVGARKQTISDIAASSNVVITTDGSGAPRAVQLRPGSRIARTSTDSETPLSGLGTPKLPTNGASRTPGLSPTTPHLPHSRTRESKPDFDLDEISAAATAAVLASMTAVPPHAKSRPAPASTTKTSSPRVKMDLDFLGGNGDDFDTDAIVRAAVASAGRR
jgi:hypothetical protein